jgi:DNA recombination protein RmuC
LRIENSTIWTRASNSQLSILNSQSEHILNTLYIIIAAAGGLVAGFVVAWLVGRTRIAALSTELEMTKAASVENLKILDTARESFQALSSEALKTSKEDFLQLAKLELEKLQAEARGDLEKRQDAVANLVKPIRDSLEKVDSNIRQMEISREGAYRDLLTNVRQLADAHVRLEGQTTKLATALRNPQVGGLWGQIQLRRVVELSGMKENYDFQEQKGVSDDERRFIPDLIVYLPNDKCIVVDAKVSTQAYLEAIEADSEEKREACLTAFLGHVQSHIDALKSKRYWEAVPNTTEFVVMFLPGENFLFTALNKDPALIEKAAENNVILATPTTLISLFKAVSYGWKQEAIAENAMRIKDAGEKLYKRLGTFVSHFAGIRRGLERASDAYNQAVGSLESRVLPAAREMKDLGVSGEGDLSQLEKVDKTTRSIQAPELLEEEE